MDGERERLKRVGQTGFLTTHPIHLTFCFSLFFPPSLFLAQMEKEISSRENYQDHWNVNVYSLPPVRNEIGTQSRPCI